MMTSTLFAVGLALCFVPAIQHSWPSSIGKDVFKDLMDVMFKIKCQEKGTTAPRKIPSFFATLKPTTGLNSNTILKFDNVKTNIGNGYNKNTGKFTAPKAGVYEFSCNFIKNKNTNWLELQLRKDKVVVAKGFADKSPYASGSVRAIFELKKGDDVYILNARSGGRLNGDGFSMFSGHMLY